MKEAKQPRPDILIAPLPRGPSEWIGKTVVECIYRNGRIASIKVTQESRRKDVIPSAGDPARIPVRNPA